MIWLTWKLFSLPPRTAIGVVRLVGVRRLFVLGVGVVIGLSVAPTTGPEFRRRMAARIAEYRSGDLAEKVRAELSTSPRTWHLPQPAVSAVGGRVTLTGSVPHAEGREELAKTAMAVPGVMGLDNQLVVAE